MRTLLRRFWDALFPIPNVSQLEAFLARVLLAATLYHFMTQGASQVTQPVPVGLAHFFNLTWLHDPQKFAMFRLAFIGALFWFTSGIALPIALPVLTVLQILPYTLLNSQGHPHHGYQILSLPLLGMSVVTVYQAFRGRAQAWPSVWQWLGLVVLVPLAVALFEAWNGSSLSSGWAGLAGKAWGEDGPERVFILTQGLVFVLLGTALTLVVHRRRPVHPEASLNAILLMTVQFMIAGAYLVSVCSKMNRSRGQWLLNSHYVALDFVKTMRQSYYGSLNPAFAHDPPGVVFLMTHETLARLFFGSGVILETILLLAVGTRALACFFGVATITMHLSIMALMTLTFPTNMMMMALFYVNIPFLLAAVINAARRPRITA